ncbi:unnamed protein product [Darwinula stevensoni]|uniref:ZZ-type domain-containing protein n=1 Tax=Darwinula stevensoni TaxID=69355 RepID=A0A7R8X8Y4_9CRUS|nr:unnamed protein product [Darwinula stevensoni]CAG0888579.1 unnamed protein product [Darwinula stevensoni]
MALSAIEPLRRTIISVKPDTKYYSKAQAPRKYQDFHFLTRRMCTPESRLIGVDKSQRSPLRAIGLAFVSLDFPRRPGRWFGRRAPDPATSWSIRKRKVNVCRRKIVASSSRTENVFRKCGLGIVVAGRCHSCREDITDVCYKCVECVDYMICSTCEADGIVHTGHNIIRVTTAMARLYHHVSGDVHADIRCFSCRGPVRGSRYKCLECRDLDLCASCEARGKEHSHHLFIRLPSRIPVVPLTPDLDGAAGESAPLVSGLPGGGGGTEADFNKEPHPGIWCASCGEIVKGRRFQCLACPGFDLCSRCEKSVEPHLVHPMIRFSRPGAFTLRPTTILNEGLHRGVNCNECGQSVTGYRYKCLKCQDYDLCMKCEAASKHLHHRLARIPPIPTTERPTPYTETRQSERPIGEAQRDSISPSASTSEQELHQQLKQRLSDLHAAKKQAIAASTEMARKEHEQRMAILAEIRARIGGTPVVESK